MENFRPKMSSTNNYLKALIIFFALSNITATAQTKTIDSLRTIYYSKTDDRQKLTNLFALCEQSNSINLDSLHKYASLANILAKKENNILDINQSNFYEAIYFSKKGNLDSAENIIESSLAQLNTKESVALKYRFLLLKSNVLIRSDKKKESIENSLQLLNASEQSGDYLTQIRAKISIGWAYMELDQSRVALNWFFDAVNMEKSVEENKKQANLYSNIAAVYNNIGKNDSAEIFVKKAIGLALKKSELTNLANAYFIYAGIGNVEQNSANTEKLLQEGLRIRKIIGDPFYIVSDIFQIGLFYANTHETDKGIALLKEGIAMAEKNNLSAKLPILYTALAENYSAAGDYKNKSAILEKLITIKDSAYTKNSAEQLAEMQTKYDVQQKETTIIRQQYDITKKNFFIYGIAGLLAATLLFGFFFFQNRKKNQRLKIQVIETEQKKKTTQAVMEAEEEERKRIAGDLHDSVAQKMVVAKLNLEALGNQIDVTNNNQQKIYNNIQSLLEESTAEVRNLSHSMMPRAFERSGLTNTVKEFVDKISKDGLKINFNAEGNFTTIKESTALMIYRIIQECVQNVLKHAKATNLDINMIAENNEIDVTIEDNGVGFNINTINQESTGLKNIRSRIEYLSGKLDINSKPGNGTVIAFYAPLQQE